MTQGYCPVEMHYMTLSWAKTSFLVPILLVGLSSCLFPGNVPEALQGKWEASGVDERGKKWFLSYEVDARGYRMNGYPPVMGRGRLNFIEQDKKHYHLEATGVVLHGQNQPNEDLWLKVDEDGTVLYWRDKKLTRKE